MNRYYLLKLNPIGTHCNNWYGKVLISCILAMRYPVLHWHTPFWHIVFPKTSEQKLFSLRQFCPKNNGWVSKKCFSLQYVMFILKTTRMWSGSHKQRPLWPHRLFCPLQRVSMSHFSPISATTKKIHVYSYHDNI